MAIAPPNSVGESVDRTNSDRRSPRSLAGHRSLFSQVGPIGPSLTQDVCSRSTQRGESAANVIMSDVYRRRADELGETRYLHVDEEVQFRSQDGGPYRRSWHRSPTDSTDLERYDTSAIGQLLSTVGDGAGGILLSVAELIAERDLRRLREYGYVGPQAVSAGTLSSMFEGPGLAVNSPVTSVRSLVILDPKPVLPSSVLMSVNGDRTYRTLRSLPVSRWSI